MSAARYHPGSVRHSLDRWDGRYDDALSPRYAFSGSPEGRQSASRMGAIIQRNSTDAPYRETHATSRHITSGSGVVRSEPLDRSHLALSRPHSSSNVRVVQRSSLPRDESRDIRYSAYPSGSSTHRVTHASVDQSAGTHHTRHTAPLAINHASPRASGDAPQSTQTRSPFIAATTAAHRSHHHPPSPDHLAHTGPHAARTTTNILASAAQPPTAPPAATRYGGPPPAHHAMSPRGPVPAHHDTYARYVDARALPAPSAPSIRTSALQAHARTSSPASAQAAPAAAHGASDGTLALRRRAPVGGARYGDAAGPSTRAGAMHTSGVSVPRWGGGDACSIPAVVQRIAGVADDAALTGISHAAARATDTLQRPQQTPHGAHGAASQQQAQQRQQALVPPLGRSALPDASGSSESFAGPHSPSSAPPPTHMYPRSSGTATASGRAPPRSVLDAVHCDADVDACGWFPSFGPRDPHAASGDAAGSWDASLGRSLASQEPHSAAYDAFVGAHGGYADAAAHPGPTTAPNQPALRTTTSFTGPPRALQGGSPPVGSAAPVAPTSAADTAAAAALHTAYRRAMAAGDADALAALLTGPSPAGPTAADSGAGAWWGHGSGATGGTTATTATTSGAVINASGATATWDPHRGDASQGDAAQGDASAMAASAGCAPFGRSEPFIISPSDHSGSAGAADSAPDGPDAAVHAQLTMGDGAARVLGNELPPGFRVVAIGEPVRDPDAWAAAVAAAAR